MQTGYFQVAWTDLKNSPGWLGKLLLLSLVGLIPFFGWIVLAGYVYGWARDIAWNLKTPLPSCIFNNPEGTLYTRGFYIVVISFVFALLPWIVDALGHFVGGFDFGIRCARAGLFAAPLTLFATLAGLASSLLWIVALYFSIIFSWGGSLRSMLYGRLSAGFQLNKIWSMIRYDFAGLMRILGMSAILSFFCALAIFVVFLALLVGAIMISFVFTGGFLGFHAVFSNASMFRVLIGLGIMGLFVSLLLYYLALVVGTFSYLMVTRALGYWIRQFDVPSWQGQDDLLPFERQMPPYTRQQDS